MLALSYSRINSFITCPLQFKLKYLDSLPEATSPVLNKGSTLHKAFQLYEEHLKKEGVETDTSNIKKIAEDAFYEEGTLLSEHLEDVLTVAQEFAQTHSLDLTKNWTFEGRVALNYEGAPCDWVDPKVAFRAVIDKYCIDGETAKIIDYKTGFKSTLDPFQLKIYAYVLSKLHPGLSYFDINLDYVRLNFSHSEMVEKDELPKIADRLAKIRKKIVGMKKYPAKPSSACSTCGYRGSACSVKVSNIEKCATLQEAQKLARDILLLEGTITTKREALKQWSKEGGYVDVGDVRFGHFPTQEYKVKVEKFINFLKAQGSEVPDIFKYLNITSAGRYLFTKGKFKDNVEDVFDLSRGSEFTHRSSVEKEAA